MTTLDLDALEHLISALKHDGFASEAEQLDEAVHRTTYDTPEDMLNELALAVRTVNHRVGEAIPETLRQALWNAQNELWKALPDFRF